MRILLIEDDKDAAAYLQTGLTENGCVVDLAYRGDDGLHLARTGDYDVIVLDVMLPGLDGWSVVESLRNEACRLPILFLTARDLVADRVRGLEAGADDYLVKPFAFSEFLARVRALGRRAPLRNDDVLRVADLTIEPAARKASRGGRRLQLSPQEFNLLVLLAARSGTVVSRTVIAEQVWDMNFDSNANVIDVAVRRLRAKIDDGFEPKLLHTNRGIGYVLEERN
ncbi:MAG: heavy metal response regulator transcription factor [Chloroflexota bacterium]|nr:heavy metal response regulator transcription factor [Chloroflexota bacterium]